MSRIKAPDVNRYFILLVFMTMIWALVSCDHSGVDIAAADKGAGAADASSRDIETSVVAGIDWYAGSVDEAFAFAAAANKPVFLYWAAEWCPPCHVIKATVFKSKEFIDRSKSFVAVYLDGDMQNAQAAGESFGVLGYPTMIVFDSAGTELTRIPSGIDIQAYAEVLDLVLDDIAPIDNILSRVINDGESLSVTDCRLLAYYSWIQNPSLLADYDATIVFSQLEAACPDDMIAERTALFFRRMNHRIWNATEDKGLRHLTSVQKEQVLRRLSAILVDYSLVKANVKNVVNYGAEMTAALTEVGTDERQELQSKFVSVFERLIDDEGVYMGDRLNTLNGKIDFERINDKSADFSKSLKSEIKKRTAWAVEVTADPYERHPIIARSAALLNVAGMSNDAKSMLLNEIEVSPLSYDLMVGLARLEREAGNIDVAITWLKQAYDASTGPATRLRWGYIYVEGLIEMTPDDAESIKTAVVKIIREEVKASGRFYQESKKWLKRLESKLCEWNEDKTRTGALTAIRNEVKLICIKSSKEGAIQSPCKTFLLDTNAGANERAATDSLG